MFLETQTLSSWLFDVSAALVAGVLGGVIVLIIQLVASPPRGAAASSSVTSFTIIQTTVTAKQSIKSSNPISVEAALGAALLGLILLFAYFPAIFGLTAGLLVFSLVATTWSTIKTTRKRLWGMSTVVTALRLVLGFVAVAYAWTSVLTFEHAGQTWETLMASATGDGVGLSYVVSGAGSLFAALTADGFALAISILGTLALSSMLLGLSLVTSYQWAAFLSVSSAPMKYFVNARARAAASVLNTTPSYLLTEVVGLLLVILLSPPVLLPLLQNLQASPVG